MHKKDTKELCFAFKLTVSFFAVLFILIGVMSPGCNLERKSVLVVYAGKGLKLPVEEIKALFEKKYPNIKLEMVYAGSLTLLETIMRTQKGDVFISGDSQTIKRGEKVIESFHGVALHCPVIAVTKANPKHILSFKDLARPGIRLALGNSEMCVVGRVADSIITRSQLGDCIRKNVLIRSSDSLELFRLLRDREADAIIIWRDMLGWPVARGFTAVEIPAGLIQPEEVDVALLHTSQNKRHARMLVDFVASEGRAVFVRHGFGGIDKR